MVINELAACGGKCSVRCSKADRTHEECLEDCDICCQKCNCVPSGTYGNKDECPCYRDMKNSKGGSKCPWTFFEDPHHIHIIYVLYVWKLHLYMFDVW